jgi:Lar family restriction alleviation protein
MDDLIASLRKGAVYGDPRNIGSSGEYDEAATDSLMNIAATALEDAYAKIDALRQELDLLRPAFFGDPSNDRREDEPPSDRSGYSPATSPCPFCGGEAVFEDPRPRGSCYYQCGRCGASAGSGSDTERDALTDWNARA